MKYLKVVNEGKVDRIFWEQIGLSTKRDKAADASIIGYKGSGAKLIVPAALRLGLKLYVCSSDGEGPYCLEYKTKKVDLGGGLVFERIIFSYSETLEHLSQLTLDSFSGWDKPIGDDKIKEFKIIREILANARDADSNFFWEIVEGDSKPERFSYYPEQTTVFVTLTEGIEEIVAKNPGKYLKFLGCDEPVWSIPGVAEAYPKSSSENRMFVFGALADCSRSFKSLFDYSVFDRHILNEDRTIEHRRRFYAAVYALLISVDSIDIAKTLIENMRKFLLSFELHCFGQINHDSLKIPEKAGKIYVAAWEALYGNNAIMASGDKLLDEDAKFRGLKLESVGGTLYAFLRKCGVKESRDYVTRTPPEGAIMIAEPTKAEKEILGHALDIIAHSMPEIRNYPVRVFTTSDPKAKWDGLAGFGETRMEEMLINRNVFEKDLERVIEVLVHELRHCVSKANDYCPEFEQQADKDEARILMHAYFTSRAKKQK